MSLTPLSDLITRYLETNAEEDFTRCMRAFLDATVGVWIPGLEGRPGAQVRADGMEIPTFYVGVGDARAVFRVCADPAVFSQRYDPRLNGYLTGRDAAEMLLKLDEEIQGILLASAASEHSLFLSRDKARALLKPRSWWSWLGLRRS